MSTIGSNSGIPQTGLDLILGQQHALEAYGRQVGPTADAAPPPGVEPVVAAPTGDPGQVTLNAQAWTQGADGSRQLPDTTQLTATLAGQSRPAAVQHGVAQVVAALAR